MVLTEQVSYFIDRQSIFQPILRTIKPDQILFLEEQDRSMTCALKAFHYGNSKNNPLRQLITKTVVIGVIAPVLAAVTLSQKLSSSATDTTKFQLW